MADKGYIQRLAKKRYVGEIRNRIVEALRAIADGLTLEEFARRIEKGDVDGALALVDLDESRFTEVAAATASAFAAGGRETIKQVGIAAEFRPGAPRAERRVEELHTHLIQGDAPGQGLAPETQAAIRDEIRDGLNRGENPRDTARRIRGQWDRDRREYVGGLVGLTRHQAAVVRRVREDLESGDPELMRRHFSRKLRDRRQDRAILKAIDEGRPLRKAQIDKIVAHYQAGMVQHRCETIARDQALEALSMGQDEAVEQMIEQGKAREQDIIEEWVVNIDGREREAHAQIPSMNPGGVRRGEMFETPHGALRRPRHRDSPGSVPENVIQCRCSLTIRVKQ